MDKPQIQTGQVPKLLLITNVLLSLIYFSWWLIPGHIGNPVLYGLLFFGECYHITLSLIFWFTVWPKRTKRPAFFNLSNNFYPSVDIFITVAGEPVNIAKQTIRNAKKIDYPNKKIYVLNDGLVARKENWYEIEQLANFENVNCITRSTPGGAKAGNINNALRQTYGEFIAVFDADMKPYQDFLKKTVPYFVDKRVGFVQSPQYYENNSLNLITKGAWEQQEFFFGPIMKGKEKSNASFICGTNFVARRTALLEVGGMVENNIAEDFLTSLLIHQKKWKSYYVKEILARGLAPEDLLSYYKQQLRWARGSLEVLFAYNPLFKRGLTFKQRLEYLASALFYFNGFVVLIDMVMPLIFLFTGIEPVATSTASFAVFFIPFMTANLYTLYVSSGGALTFTAISFSQSSWFLQLQALSYVIAGQRMEFAVTSKKKVEGNFLNLVYPHLFYITTFALAALIGFIREGLNPSVLTNIAWGTFNCVMFLPFIQSSFNWSQTEKHREIVKDRIKALEHQREIPKFQY